jgi:hypothetical protein
MVYTKGYKSGQPCEHLPLIPLDVLKRHWVNEPLDTLDRFAKVFGTEAESLMMDRHDEMSAGFIVPECSANESRDCKRRSA